MELKIFIAHMISRLLSSNLPETGSASGIDLLSVIRRGKKHAKGESQGVWFFLANLS